MNPLTHLETEVELAGIKFWDLLNLTSQEAHMRDALKTYKQFIADTPSPGESEQQDKMERILAWRAKGAAASQELETQAKELQAELIKTVQQSNRDKEVAGINVNDLQRLIDQLNAERDQLSESIKELETAKSVDNNLKLEYRSQYSQYIIFFILMVIVVAILFRVQISQESGTKELVILVAAVLFMIYHFFGWIKAIAIGIWRWLNALIHF